MLKNGEQPVTTVTVVQAEPVPEPKPEPQQPPITPAEVEALVTNAVLEKTEEIITLLTLSEGLTQIKAELLLIRESLASQTLTSERMVVLLEEIVTLYEQTETQIETTQETVQELQEETKQEEKPEHSPSSDNPTTETGFLRRVF